MVRGDVDIAATGTVTTVEKGKVLAFGHPFFGAGAISGITVTVHGSNEQKAYDIKPAYEDYDPHGGGDFGIIDNLYDKMTNDEPETILSSAVHSHIVSFAAEEAMVTGKVVDISKFEAEHKK